MNVLVDFCLSSMPIFYTWYMSYSSLATVAGKKSRGSTDRNFSGFGLSGFGNFGLRVGPGFFERTVIGLRVLTFRFRALNYSSKN